MREPFLARVASGRPIVGDGAWGSLLIERGLPSGRPPELWTLERPDVIRDIADRYLEAGAEILTTNTFGGSPLRLRMHRLEARAEEINGRAVELALRAAEGRAWVSASVGPTGLLFPPLGTASPDMVYQSFALQIGTLARAGADLLCIETMTDLDEAVLAVRAAKATAPGLPLIATMTFDLTPRGAFTVMGCGVSEAVGALAGAGADLVGANCGHGSGSMVEVAREICAHTSVPISIRPNAGLPVRRDGRIVYEEGPEEFARFAAALLRPGVALIGGCCGTAPEHIRAIAGRLLSTRAQECKAP